MTEQEKMHQTALYLPNDPAIVEEQTRCLEKLYDYNQTRPGEGEKRAALLKEMFAEIGEGCYIEPPLHANFGGKFVHFGKNVYANFNLTLVDDTHIYVGDYTMFGPNVTVATAGHPILPQLRAQGYQYNAAVHIGKIAGSAPGPSFCRALPSGITWWWAPAAWSPGTCPTTWWRWAIPAGCCVPSAITTGNTTSNSIPSTPPCCGK